MRSVPTPHRPQRARQPEEKEQRRQEILKAAESLWLESSYQDLSMNQIASGAGLAKGTLYLYFKTKEEIFLELLLIYTCDWADEMARKLDKEPALEEDQMLHILAKGAHECTSFKNLLVLYTGHLGGDIEPEQARAFYKRISASMQPLLSKMPFGRQNMRVLLHLYALSIGWHLVAKDRKIDARLPEEMNMEHSLPYERELELALRATVHSLVRGEHQA